MQPLINDLLQTHFFEHYRQVSQIIEQLTKLDLSKYPYSEVRDLIGKLGRVGSILFTLHKGKTIMRARPNYNNETFNSKCQLTYKPQQLNKTYQRASTPNMTMFYGSLIPDKYGLNELDNSRVIGAFEALTWLRDNTTCGIQKITFGRWVVKDDINLIAIMHKNSFYEASSHTRELVDAFKNDLKKHPELEEVTILVSEFFANEFAKKETHNDFDYMLSAILTEMIVERGIDGVYYPSVRVDGQGFNIAIKPETADNCLELIAAGECIIYKNKGKVVVDNETISQLKPNQSNFELLPIDPKYHAGQKRSLHEIGVESIEEFLKQCV